MIQVTSGTQTATLTTEHTLSTQTSAQTYVLVVNLVNLAAGDSVTLSVKTKVLTGSTERLSFTETITGVQECPVFFSIPIPTAWSAKFILQQTTGTGRSFEWSVCSL